MKNGRQLSSVQLSLAQVGQLTAGQYGQVRSGQSDLVCSGQETVRSVYVRQVRSGQVDLYRSSLAGLLSSPLTLVRYPYASGPFPATYSSLVATPIRGCRWGFLIGEACEALHACACRFRHFCARPVAVLCVVQLGLSL